MFHILVIDDDKNTRLFLRATLESNGYTVSTAQNGEEALEVMSKEHVDLAVVDIMMPKMNGYEFTSTPITTEGEYTLGGAKIIYRNNICRLEDGTIAGSILRLNKGVWNIYKNSKIPLHECVNCASLNPATTLGIADRKGSIAPGKDADIVILDNEFNVTKTIIGGIVRYEA